MENINLYEDVEHVDLGNEIVKLEEQNKQLLDHIRKLEGDIKKLCSALTKMKEVQENLGRNISELYKTAKLEIQRKDRIIAELRQELDDKVLGRRSTFNSKRHLREGENKDSPKRFKNNSTHTETGSFIDKKSVKSEGSISDSERITKCESNKEAPKLFKNNLNDGQIISLIHEKDDKSARSTPDSERNIKYHEDRKIGNHRDYKSDVEVSRNLRHSSPNNFQKNTKYEDQRTYDSRYRRNRSTDRFRRSRNNERRRSRSTERFNDSRNNDRYKRSRSSNRWRESRNLGRGNHYDLTEERYNHRREASSGRRSSEKFMTAPVYRSENDKRTELKMETDLADDSMEDGEITPESDNLATEDQHRDVNYRRNDKNSLVFNNVDTKSITIEEYRSRKGNPSNTDENIVTPSFKKRLVETDNIQTDINKAITDLENHSSSDRIDKSGVVQNAVEDNERRSTINNTNESVNNEHCVEKSVETDMNKLSDKAISNNCLNDSIDNTPKLFHGDDSRSSNNSSFSNNENVSLNNLSNNSARLRRRRCVIIGFKEKAQ